MSRQRCIHLVKGGSEAFGGTTVESSSFEEPAEQEVRDAAKVGA